MDGAPDPAGKGEERVEIELPWLSQKGQHPGELNRRHNAKFLLHHHHSWFALRFSASYKLKKKMRTRRSGPPTTNHGWIHTRRYLKPSYHYGGLIWMSVLWKYLTIHRMLMKEEIANFSSLPAGLDQGSGNSSIQMHIRNAWLKLTTCISRYYKNILWTRIFYY
jgi:hypothetical protein